MPVYTLKANEEVVLRMGSGIAATVRNVTGGNTRLKIDAPRYVAIDRGAVDERKQAERKAV